MTRPALRLRPPPQVTTVLVVLMLFASLAVIPGANAQTIPCNTNVTDSDGGGSAASDLLQACADLEGDELSLAIRTQADSRSRWSAYVNADGRPYRVEVEVPSGNEARALVFEATGGELVCEAAPSFGSGDGWRYVRGISAGCLGGQDITPLSVAWFAGSGFIGDRAPDDGAAVVAEGDGLADGDPTVDGPLAAGCSTRIVDPDGSGTATSDILEACADYDGALLHLGIRTQSDAFAGWSASINADGRGYVAFVEVTDGSPARAAVRDVSTDAVTCEATPTWGPADGFRYVKNLDVARCFGGADADLTAQFASGRNLSGDTAPDSGPVDVINLGGGSVPSDDPDRAPTTPGDLPPAPGGLRLAGADRFATSAAVALYAWPDGAAEVYLARADNPVDALSGGSLPFGPIVLVPQCGELPGSVVDAIETLDPERVIALGGSGAICDDILEVANAVLL